LAEALESFGSFKDFVRSSGLAMVGKVADVLEGVVVELLTVGLIRGHEESEAVKLGRLDNLLSIDVFKDSLEKAISAHSHFDVFSEFLVRLFRGEISDHVVEMVKSSISGVNRRVFEVVLLLVGLGKFLDHLAHERNIVNIIDTLEVTNWEWLVAQVTELLDMGLSSLSLNSGVLSSKVFVVDVMGIRVFHPLNGESITKARVDVGAVNHIIRVAVVTP